MTGGSDRLDFLIRAYPKAYRERRGEEILGTLREDAPTLGAYESLRVGIDMVVHGLRLRLGVAPDQLMGRILVAAALPGMMMAAAVAMVMPLFGHILPDHRNPGSWGPATAIWPGLCGVWILGSLAVLVFPRRIRLVAAVCISATAVTQFLLPLGLFGLPSGFLLLVCLAVPSILAARTPPRWSHRHFAVATGGLILGVLVVAAVRTEWYSSGIAGSYGDIVRCTPYVAVTLIIFTAVLLVARRWVTGSAIALLATPWLLLPAGDAGPLTAPTTVSPIAVAAFCAIGAGLLGVWASDLWKSHRTFP